MSVVPDLLTTPRQRSHREASLLGYLLSNAHGFRVETAAGRELGTLKELRYERHTDFPEELIIRRGRLLWKRQQRIPFDTVAAVQTRAKTIRLAPDPKVAVQVRVDFRPHEARRLERAILPGKHTARDNAVKADLGEGRKQSVPINLALANIEMLMDSSWRARRVDDVP